MEDRKIKFNALKARLLASNDCLLDPSFDGEFPERLPHRHYATGYAVADASGDSYKAWQRENRVSDEARARMSRAQMRRWGIWVDGIDPNL
jgi:hypothetical protein